MSGRAPTTGGRRKTWRYVSVAVSILLVVGIFVFAIPKIADYRDVWATITTLTPLGFATLFAAMIFNLFTYWWANMAALPGLTMTKASVVTQTTTSVANTLPGGGAIAVGLTYTILRSWGFTGTDIALYVGVTGIWNIFTKLALPVLSVAVLVIQGKNSATYVTAAVVGLAVLGGAVALLAAVFWSEQLARRVGSGLGRAASALRRIIRKPPITDGADRAARFRSDTIVLVERRWEQLTFFTLLSHLALFFVLLLSLRFVGVPEGQVSTAAVFATFAFGRLLSALPITPGGLGVIELGYIGGLVAAGAPKPEAVAAVLLFRTLTFGIQIPLGGFTYMIWRAKADWRRTPPDEAAAQPSSVATTG